MAAPTPLDSPTDLLSLSILVEGEALDDTIEIASVEVIKNINKIPMAQISILDGSVSKEDFTASESDNLVPGKSIEIQAGYHSEVATIFKGIIMSQTIKTHAEEAPMLILDCKDEAIKMTLGRKNAYYSDATDSDVITSIIGNYELTATVTATTVQHGELIQYYANDWDFIMARSEINGHVIAIDDGTVTIGPPDVSSSAVLEVTYGDSIIESEITVSSKEQLASVQASSWDLSTQALLQSSSSEPTVNEQGNITGSTLSDVMSASDYALQSTVPLDKDSLQQWADAQLLKSRINRFQGTLSFQGNALPKPNTVITVGGLGDRMNGDGYITSVRHDIDNGNWITEVGFGISEKWYTEEMEAAPPKAGGILPGVNGLQIGVVKQIDSDPDNDYRVLVTLPLISDSDTGVWARLSSFYASSGFGAFFYPEIGDEVVLGFLDDNPTYPVILGSLYSASRTAPYTPDETNSIKSIMTSSKMELSFDDENKVITVLTPGGNSFVLSDKDSSITITDLSGNKAEFTDSGITITSQSALTLKATDGVTIEGSDVSIKASSGSLAAEGASGVTVKSSAALSLEGQASSELKASGNVTISGAMVSIN